MDSSSMLTIHYGPVNNAVGPLFLRVRQLSAITLIVIEFLN